jgi:hypothetical protein
MDTNPKNCAKCGHTVNDTAVACAYCGADISSEGSPPQPDDQVPGTIASPGEPSSLPADDSLPVLDTRAFRLRDRWSNAVQRSPFGN